MMDGFLIPLSEVDDYLAVGGQGAGRDKVYFIGADEAYALQILDGVYIK
jgi:hypothetical protein